MKKLQEGSRVKLPAGTAVTPGGTVSVTVQAQPWPDPKLRRVEVELA